VKAVAILNIIFGAMELQAIVLLLLSTVIVAAPSLVAIAVVVLLVVSAPLLIGAGAVRASRRVDAGDRLSRVG